MNYEEQRAKWKPTPKTYYYRNVHGKVIAVNENVDFEQYNIHKKYYGNSDDLRRAGYNELEAIADYLEKNITNPTYPIDTRKQIHTSQSGWQFKGQQSQP